VPVHVTAGLTQATNITAIVLLTLRRYRTRRFIVPVHVTAGLTQATNVTAIVLLTLRRYRTRSLSLSLSHSINPRSNLTSTGQFHILTLDLCV
jgi:predicted membrane protein